MNRNSSFVPLLLLIIIVLVGLGSVSRCTGGLGRNADVAASELDNWARELGLAVAHRTCNAVDSDGDGYVSCQYTLQGTPDAAHQVECAASFNLQRGCREPKVHVPGTVHVRR